MRRRSPRQAGLVHLHRHRRVEEPARRREDIVTLAFVHTMALQIEEADRLACAADLAGNLLAAASKERRKIHHWQGLEPTALGGRGTLRHQSNMRAAYDNAMPGQ
jgi:hypothetical protein